MSGRHRLSLAAVALSVCALVASCSRANSVVTAAAAREPARVTSIGDSGLHRIVLSSDGARRIGLATATVTERVSAGRSTLIVASAAVFYQPDGTTWVYLRTAPLTFQRARVVVTRVDGDTADLSAGPRAGSVVATVGVAELRGAEDGVPGEQ